MTTFVSGKLYRTMFGILSASVLALLAGSLFSVSAEEAVLSDVLFEAEGEMLSDGNSLTGSELFSDGNSLTESEMLSDDTFLDPGEGEFFEIILDDVYELSDEAAEEEWFVSEADASDSLCMDEMHTDETDALFAEETGPALIADGSWDALARVEQTAVFDDPLPAVVETDRKEAAAHPDNSFLPGAVQEEGMAGNGFLSEEAKENAVPMASGEPDTENWYYNQLTEAGKIFYDLRYEHFCIQRKTDVITTEYTGADSPYSFTASAVLDEETGTYIDEIDITTDAYVRGYETLLCDVRAAFDAFCYDHPEIFWTRMMETRFAFDGVFNRETGEAVVYLSNVTITPTEAFDGAAALWDQFDEAVNAAALSVLENSDYDHDGVVSKNEALQGIHDYICKTCYYDYAGARKYKRDPENTPLYIFTPCGAFLPEYGTGFVCEGYSRAFKILCRHMGIPCVLVCGRVSYETDEGHMWNAVFYEDQWRLVDVTMDDTVTGISYSYFLCNAVAGRIEEGNVSGWDYLDEDTGYIIHAYYFNFPAMEEGELTFDEVDNVGGYCYGYSTWVCEQDSRLRYWTPHDNSVTEEEALILPTCTREGKTAQVLCAHCKGILGAGEIIPPTGHIPETMILLPETDGTAEAVVRTVCSVCGQQLAEDKKYEEDMAEHESGIRETDDAAAVTGQAASAAEQMSNEQTVGVQKQTTPYLTLSISGVLPMKVGQKTNQIRITGILPGDRIVSCTSAKSRIASVICSAKEKKVRLTLKAKKPGKTVITVRTALGAAAAFTVKVQKKPVSAQKITIDTKKISLTAGGKYRLKPVLFPVTSQDKLIYTTSNSKVASVSSKGVIKAKRKGKATVTIKAGKKKLKVQVRVQG